MKLKVERIISSNLEFLFRKLVTESTITQLFKHRLVKSYIITPLFWGMQQNERIKYFSNGASCCMKSETDLESSEPFTQIIKDKHGKFVGIAKNFPRNEQDRCAILYMFVLNRKENIERFQRWRTDIFKKVEADRLRSGRIMVKSYTNSENGSDRWKTRRGRSMDSIFINREIKDKLIHSLKQYMARSDWFEQNGIPNHFGIMLHGEPGTGKSSIAQALAHYFGTDLCVLTGDSLNVLQQVVNKSSVDTSYTIILIEDIDTYQETETRDTENTQDKGKDRKIGMGTILNLLDGPLNGDHIIYIFTTNHPEKLDPAITRPGRIDLDLYISYPDDDAMNQFLKYYYKGRSLPNGYHVNEKISFASCQIDIMNEMPFERFLEKYCRKDA